MQPHLRDFQHIPGAQAIPRIHHAIVAERDVDPLRQQFRHPRHATPLGITVMPPLQGDIDQRIGHHVHPGFGHQGQQFAYVVVIHAVHRGQMRPGDPPLQAQALGFIGQRLHMARKRVIRFVAVHIHR